MELGEYKGMEYVTAVSMEHKDNTWFVKHKVKQRISNDREVWDEREVVFESKEEELEKAIAAAAVLATLYLESIDFDLFSVDFELKEGEFVQ